MNYKHFIVTSILAMDTLYAMDEKKYAPQLLEITSKETPITFKKKTKPFEYWMLHKKNSTFGENRFFEYMDKQKGLTLIETIVIPSNDRSDIRLAYISNLEKRYINHKNFVMLGAFLLYDSGILIENQITILTDYYHRNIPQTIRPQKSLTQTAITASNSTKDEKKTRERGSMILRELFNLIETHGEPKSLLVMIPEDLLLLNNTARKKYSSESSEPDEQPKAPEVTKKSQSSLSRKPSRHIAKLSGRSLSTKKKTP